VIEELLAQAERQHGVDLGDGVQILDATAVVRRPFDPGLALIVLPAGSLGGGAHRAPAERPGVGDGSAPEAPFDPPVLPGRNARAADPADVLRALYPSEHAVLALGTGAETTVGELTAARLEQGAHLVPALSAESNAASPHGLPWLVARLRAPGGCPWDREQTHQSLRKYLLEEAHEVYDALEAGSTTELAGELGDLLLQVVLHAHYAAEDGVFDLTDVYRSVISKIIRRHPHVFGEVEARSVDQVLRNWERIKADERAGNERRHASGMPEAFAGLSRSLPALAYSQEMQERAASLGYDWPDVAGVVDKMQEETGELLAADPGRRKEELGDLLMVTVNLARKLGVDAEAALRFASAKFARRFAEVERLAAAQEVSLTELSPAALDELWQSAKAAPEAVAPGPGDGSGREDAP
jgi:tetrapyrrole methylase family protein/MazG family protein